MLRTPRRRNTHRHSFSPEALETRIVPATSVSFDVFTAFGTASVDAVLKDNGKVKGTIDLTGITVPGVDVPDSVRFKGTSAGLSDFDLRARFKAFVAALGDTVKARATVTDGALDPDLPLLTGHVTVEALGSAVFDTDFVLPISGLVVSTSLVTSTGVGTAAAGSFDMLTGFGTAHVAFDVDLTSGNFRGTIDLSDLIIPGADVPDVIKFKGTINSALDFDFRTRIKVLLAGGGRTKVKASLDGSIAGDVVTGTLTLKEKGEPVEVLPGVFFPLIDVVLPPL